MCCWSSNFPKEMKLVFGTWDRKIENIYFYILLHTLYIHKRIFVILRKWNHYWKTYSFWLDDPCNRARKVLIIGSVCRNHLDERDSLTVTLRMSPAYDVAGFDYITAFAINFSHIPRNCCDNKALLVEFIQEINKLRYNLTFPW